MGDIMIRPYNESDEKSCLELYNQVHPEKMSWQEWRWKNIKGPMGRSIIETAWENDRLAGFYTLIPRLLSAGGKTVLGAFSDIALTHPDYRYRGIFSSLGKELYARASLNGIEIIYGFPTDHSIHCFNGRLGWDHIVRGRRLYCWGCGEGQSGDRFKVDRVKEIGENFKVLWKMMSDGLYKNYKITIRDKEYLRWRFLQRPGNDYEIFLARENAGKPAGYAFVSGLAGKDEECVDIVDIMAASTACFRYMVNYIKENYSGTSIRIKIPGKSIFYQMAKGLGFREGGKHYYFGFKVLKKGAGENGEWYYTMSDRY